MTRILGFFSFIAQPIPADEAASADGCDHRFERRFCCNNSRPRVPCPAITASSSNAWTKVRPSAAGTPPGLEVGFVIVLAMENDFCAVRLSGQHFDLRRVDGHVKSASECQIVA